MSLTLLGALIAIGAVTRAQSVQKLAVDGFNPNTNGTVRAVAVQADGQVLLGGDFTSPRNHIARVGPTGTLDAFNPNPNGSVAAIAVQPDGKILVTGTFTGLGGAADWGGNYIARVNPDGTVDPSLGGSVSSPFRFVAITLQPDGKILYVLQDSSGASQGVGRLTATGGDDFSFTPTWATFPAPWNMGSAKATYSVAVQPDGKVLVGGQGFVARLKSDGSVDASFGAQQCNEYGNCSNWTTVNGDVYAIVVQADGSILVGGDFSTLVGVGRSSFGRLNPDGTLDTAFRPLIDSRAVITSVQLQADGKMVVGGQSLRFIGIPGGRMGAINVQRLNADGSRDDTLAEPTFSADYSSFGSVYALATDVSQNPYGDLVGKIVAGGTFAKLHEEFNDLYLSRGNIARMYTTPDPYDSGAARLATQQLIVSPSFMDTGQLTWTYGGSSPEPMWAIFQFSTDGANWSPIATATRTTGGWAGTAAQTHLKGYIRALGYYGSGQYNGSGSVITSPVQQVDSAYDSTTSIAGPYEAWAGDSVTLTATVNPSGTSDVPTGTVTFKDGNTTICVQPLTNGQATCASTFATLGYHYISASYSGAAEFRASASPAPLGLMVNGVPTFTTLASSPNPSTAGQSVTFTATVTRGGGGDAPPAIVTFFDDTTVLGTATLTSGVATLATSALTTSGRHHVTAQYAGSYQYGTSTSNILTHKVVIPPPPADTFNPGANFDVLAIAVQADGKSVVGGYFTTLGGQSRNRIGRLNPDGSLDAGFNPGADRYVRAIAVQPDGKIFVGGAFTQLGGQTCNSIARLNANGTIETCFGVGADGDVWAFAVQPDGKTLVGGSFTNLAGQPRNHVARLNADGTLDASFDPGTDVAVQAFFSDPLDPGVAVFALQPDGKILMGSSNGVVRLMPNGTPEWLLNGLPSVYALAVQPDGKILTGGAFGIGRRNTDGSLDSGFTATLPGALMAMAVQADGKIWAGGSFQPINDPLYYLYRLNPDGSVDFSTPLGTGAPVVRALAIQSDGQVLVGGHFLSLGDQSRSFIGRLTNDTAAAQQLTLDADTAQLTWVLGGSSPELMWAAFEFSTDGSNWSPVVLAPNTTITRTAVGWTATLDQPHVTGTFRAMGYYGTSMGSGSVSTSTWPVDEAYDTTTDVAIFPVAPLVGDGVTLTATVSPVSPGTGTPAGSVAFFSGGNPIAGCGAQALSSGQATCTTSFGAVGAYTITAQYGGAAEFHASTSPGYTLVIPSATSTTLAASPNPSTTGQSVTLTATVSSPGGVPAGNVAFFDGATMIGAGTLNASGVATQAAAFAINGTHNLTAQYAGSAYFLGSTSDTLSQQVQSTTPPDGFNPAVDGAVWALAVQPDGKVVVGGTFASMGGQTRNQLGRLNADGTLDSGFDASADRRVDALAVQPDGKIVVGGSFLRLNGDNPHRSIGRLNADGSLDASFNATAAGAVRTLAVQPDGRIVLGGYFTDLNGVPRTHIGRLNVDGSLDASFDPGTSGLWVRTLALQPDGKILVGGDFGSLGGGARAGVGRLNADGSLDLTFTSPLLSGSTVGALAVQPDGRILVAGYGPYGTSPLYFFHRLNANGSVDATFTSPIPDDAVVVALALQTDGRIVLCGLRSNVAFLYRLNVDGSFDDTFTPQVEGGPASVVGLQPDGKILVGGWFTAVDGQPRSNLARLTNDIAASQAFSFDVNTGQLTWMRGGSSPELMWAAFQFSTDGASWSPMAAAARIDGGWSASVAQPHVTGTFRALGHYGTGPNSVSLVISTLDVNYAYGTTTAVAVSPVSPREGESATITATVSPVPPGTGTPAGSVAFFSDGNPIAGCGARALSSGEATCDTSFDTLGAYTITARYGGEAGFLGSTSDGYPLSVRSRIVATSTSISAPGISYGSDGTVTVTVVATGGATAPTGSVSLVVNSGTPISQALIAGPEAGSAATFTLTTPSAGSHTLSATYTPTGDFSTSEAGGSSLTVDPATPTIQVSAAGTIYTGLSYAGATSCTAEGVNGEHPSATLSYEDGSHNPLSSAPTDAGNYFVRCSAGGTGTNYAATSDTAAFTISPATPTVTVSGEPVTYDGNSHEATCSATGVGDVTVAGSCTLTYDGSATAPIAAKTSYVVVATFTSSDPNYSDGTGRGSLTINKRAAAWTTNPNSKIYGTADPDPLTTGSGTFLAADNISATYTRDPGNTAAAYHIAATLVDPDGTLVNYDPVTNTGATFTITRANTSTTAPGISARFGDPPVTLTANITAILPSTPIVNEGSVTFVVTTAAGTVLATLGPAVVAGGKASANLTLGPAFVPGYYDVAVTYNPASVAPNFNGSSTLGGVDIDPAQTTLVVTTPAPTQYSDPLTLTATVSPATLNGQAISGSVEFFIAGVSVGSAAVNAAGVATKPGVLNMRAPANYNVTAAFTSTNSNFTSSSGGPAVLAITQEDARAVSTGLTSLSTPSATRSDVSVTLVATVQDITGIVPDPAFDGYPGDIRNARVTFLNRNQSNTPFPGCSGLMPTLLAPGDLKTGVVSCVTTLTTGSADSATYQVGIAVAGYYTRNSPYDDFDVNVYKPGTGFVGGGGHLINTASAGVYAGTAGARTTFGFNAKVKKPKVFQGHVNIIVRSRQADGQWKIYQIKSTAIDSLSIMPGRVKGTGTGQFLSKATLSDITNPLAPISLGGNYQLQVTVFDNGDPGTSDALAVALWNGSALLYSSNWSGAPPRTVPQILAGGNLQAR